MKGILTNQALVEKLRGIETDRSKIVEAVKRYGNLPVKIALLALATEKRIYSPYWIGCPPGVFLSYKWSGPESKAYVEKVHDYLSSLGYNVYFDQNELDEAADTYTEVPAYISHVGDCQYYVLILTRKTADYITARNNKTSWIFDEYQQAVTLVNRGRLWLVPLLIEEEGRFGVYDSLAINMVDDIYNFKKLDAVFQSINFKINEEQKQVLTDFLNACDVLIYKKRWNEAREFFEKFILFKNFPDYQFKLLIFSICIGDQQATKASFDSVEDFIGKDPTRLLNGYASIYQIEALSNYLAGKS